MAHLLIISVIGNPVSIARLTIMTVKYDRQDLLSANIGGKSVCNY